MVMNLGLDFSLQAHDGTLWWLGEALTKGPVMIVFYRGDW